MTHSEKHHPLNCPMCGQGNNQGATACVACGYVLPVVPREIKVVQKNEKSNHNAEKVITSAAVLFLLSLLLIHSSRQVASDEPVVGTPDKQAAPADVIPAVLQLSNQDLINLGYVSDGPAIGASMPAFGEIGGLKLFFDNNGAIVNFEDQIKLPSLDRIDLDLLPGPYDPETATQLFRKLLSTVDENRETKLQVEGGQPISAYYFYQDLRNGQTYGKGISILNNAIQSIASIETGNNQRVLSIVVRLMDQNGQMIDLPIPAPLWGQKEIVNLRLGSGFADLPETDLQYQYAFNPLNTSSGTQFSLPGDDFGLSLTAVDRR